MPDTIYQCFQTKALTVMKKEQAGQSSSKLSHYYPRRFIQKSKTIIPGKPIIILEIKANDIPVLNRHKPIPLHTLDFEKIQMLHHETDSFKTLDLQTHLILWSIPSYNFEIAVDHRRPVHLIEKTPTEKMEGKIEEEVI